jgi:hypothetical protein
MNSSRPYNCAIGSKRDWSRVNLTVEESLRFVSPVQFSKPRFVGRDLELDGVMLRKGDRIMAMLAAPTGTLPPTHTPKGSIWPESPITTGPLAPASISASDTSWRGSRPSAR